MKIGLVIPVYNRPEYVRECFASIQGSDIPKGTQILIVDDCSTDVEITNIINNFMGTTVKRLRENGGVRNALLWGCEWLFNNGNDRQNGRSAGVDIVINLDSDAIVRPDFIKRLTELHRTTGLITSGFNNPKEPFISDGCKAHANGINMCFNREQYEQHIKPALLAKSGNWDSVAASKTKFAITVPSCVQHIGLQSSMGHTGADVAHDFKRLTLPNVTLFGIDSHDKSGINRAAEISQRDIEYGAVKIITDDLFTRNGTREQRRTDYSKFMIKNLTEHFNTSHVLTIHADGYVLNWKAWRDEWLQYDYIGASWWFKDGMNVGNGGFSLRSKKLCDLLATSDLQGEHYHPEDEAICRTYRPALEAKGINFAPAEVADRFSIEAYSTPPPHNKYSGQFGFHSVHVDLSDLPKDLQYKPTPPTQGRKILHSRRR